MTQIFSGKNVLNERVSLKDPPITPVVNALKATPEYVALCAKNHEVVIVQNLRTDTNFYRNLNNRLRKEGLNRSAKRVLNDVYIMTKSLETPKPKTYELITIPQDLIDQFHEHFEVSHQGLTWKVGRNKGKLVGTIGNKKQRYVIFKGKSYAVKSIVWAMTRHANYRPHDIKFKDGNPLNCNPENLYVH